MADWDKRDWVDIYQKGRVITALEKNEKNTKRLADAADQQAKATLIKAQAQAEALRIQNQIVLEKHNVEKELKNAKNKLAKYHKIFDSDLTNTVELSASEFIELIDNKNLFNTEKTQLLKSLEHENVVNEIRLINDLIKEIEAKIRYIETSDIFNYVENIKMQLTDLSLKENVLSGLISEKNSLETENQQILNKLISLAENLNYSKEGLITKNDFLKLSESSYKENFKPLTTILSKWQAIAILCTIVYIVSISLYGFAFTIPILIVSFFTFAKFFIASAAFKKLLLSLEQDICSFSRFDKLKEIIPNQVSDIARSSSELKEMNDKIEAQNYSYIKSKKVSADTLNNLATKFRRDLT